jgi:hypothetical protein
LTSTRELRTKSPSSKGRDMFSVLDAGK